MQALVVADIGSALTKTALLCRVEGSLLLVASSQVPTSNVAPRSDVRQGIRDGVAMLEASTGRRLLNDEFLMSPAQPDGNGVDYFLATSSTGEALTLLVLVSDARSPEAINFFDVAPRYFTAPAQLATFNLAGGTRPTRAQLTQWQVTPLDAVLFVPAAKQPRDAAARANELAQFLASASKRKGIARLPLFFVGTQHELDSLGLLPSEDLAWQSLASEADPTVDPLVALAGHLNKLYQDRQQRLVPGLEGLGQFLGAPLQTGLQSLGVAADFLAKSRDAYTLVVDAGSATTTAVSSDRQTLEWGSAPGKGVGSGAPGVVAAAGSASVTRWLPQQLAPAHVEDVAMNRALFPWAMPVTREDLQFDHALAIEAIRLALGPRDRKAAHAALDLVVATGSLFRGTPDAGQVVLSLLNALEPVGRTIMVLDRYGILQPAAVLSQHEPELVRGLLGADALEPLGTCIGLAGKAKDGVPALHVKVLDGPEAGRDITINAGAIHVLPVGAGQSVTLELRPLGRLSLGLRPGEGVRAEHLQGGSVGIVLDARPRPLALPTAPAERAAKLASWMEAFHAY